MVRDGKLLPRPDFQRRLVWSRNDKNLFIDTILRGYPFPEIYIADGDVDVDTGEGTQLLVDGQQRVNTIIQYFAGSPDLKLTTALPYETLDEDAKKSFLQYKVAVRDLGSVGREEIIEVFRRINATKYALRDIEINNAVYAGAMKKFIERCSKHDFFIRHNIFTPSDYARMGDMRYVLSIVATMILGYFNRDDDCESILSEYNDDFSFENDIENRLNACIDFIEECGFEPKERVWKKADLFTLIIELDEKFDVDHQALQPDVVVTSLSEFYGSVNGQAEKQSKIASIYYKAALQASNDRINRVRRGLVISGILSGLAEQKIEETLVQDGLT